jgi:hypothetical protein
MTATGAAAGKLWPEECKSSLDRSRGITGDIPDQNSASGKCGASSPLWWQRGDGPIFVLRQSTLGNDNILYHSRLGLASPKQVLASPPRRPLRTTLHTSRLRDRQTLLLGPDAFSWVGAPQSDWDSQGLRVHRTALAAGHLTICKRKAQWRQRTPRKEVDLRQSRLSRRSRTGSTSRPSVAEVAEVPWSTGAKSAVHGFDSNIAILR